MTTAELAEALRPVIKEVVKEAMQSELREILTEAVEIASRPIGGSDSFEIEDTAPVAPRPKVQFEKPDWVQDMETKHSEAEAGLHQTVQESKKKTAKTVDDEAAYMKQKNAIMGLLGETAKHMTAEDLNNFK